MIVTAGNATVEITPDLTGKVTSTTVERAIAHMDKKDNIIWTLAGWSIIQA